jgi:hypothetical protein
MKILVNPIATIAAAKLLFVPCKIESNGDIVVAAQLGKHRDFFEKPGQVPAIASFQ